MPATISVIVPALDEGSSIGRPLAALAPLRARGHEIIVVDGGSEDDTRAALPADRVIEAPRGRARQMNAGARAARAVRGSSCTARRTGTRSSSPAGFASA